MKSTKIISLFLASLLVVMLASSMSVLNVSAAWDGSVSGSLAGSGTEADPYLISDGADLAYLAARVNGGDKCLGYYFKQTADIDLGGREWTPIGTSATLYFAGGYNGSGFVVSNFTVTDQQYGGLFGYMNGGIETGIKNVIVSDADVSGTYCGIIVSYAIGGSYVKGCVAAENCAVRGTHRIGGIAATLSTGARLSYCINNATITGIAGAANGTGYGGIVGVHAGHSTMKYCVNNGDVIGEAGPSAKNRAGGYGGIVGVWSGADARADIEYCYNTGDVRVGDIDVVSGVYVGGIVGIAAWVDMGSFGAHLMSNCFNFGEAELTMTNPNAKAVGAFAGLTRYGGIELRNIYALEGTAASLVGEQRFEPDPAAVGFDFLDQATLEKYAAAVNKYLLDYNPAFSSWLLSLDVSNVKLPRLLDSFGNSIEDLNKIASPSASFTNEESHPWFLSDGTEAYWSAAGYTGEDKPWVQYDFPCAVIVEGCLIKWFDDGGGSRVAKAVEIQYWNGEEFVPTVPKGNYTYTKNIYNTYRFSPVETTAIRVVINPTGALGDSGTGMPAISEWNVIGTLADGAVVPKPELTSIAGLAKPTAAFSNKADFVFHLNDDTDAFWSAYGYTDTRLPWVQYNFPVQISLNGCVVKWYDDGSGIAAPKSVDIQYWDGDEFVSVEKVGGYAYLPNQDNIYKFNSVDTNAIRIIITPTGALGGDGKGMPGIVEWNVIGYLLMEYTENDLVNNYFLSTDKEPDTGDATVYAVAAMAVSSVSLAALLIAKRRKEQRCQGN